MISIRPRPEFSHTVTTSIEKAQEKITRRISRDDAPFEVKSFPGFISLRVPHEERHFWSLRLNLSIEEIDEGKTQLLGKYGPNANV
ncbi:MAG: hypothetical protein ACKVJU_04245 [Verrucomicrobiales bacterium]